MNLRRLLKTKDAITLLTASLVIGILLISAGIYLTGTNTPGGNYIIILGAFIVYISIIVLVFKI